MKIVHLTSHLHVGGIPAYVVTLAEQLTARGHQIIVGSADGLLQQRLATGGITRWPLPLATSAELSPLVWMAAWRLTRRLRHESVDLIHAHTRVAQVLAEWLWRSLGIPYVTTWHGIYRCRAARRRWPCTGKMTIAISEPVAMHLREVFDVPAARIRVIPHGVDLSRFGQPMDSEVLRRVREPLRLRPEHVVVGTMTRLVPEKGIEILVDAFAELARHDPNLILLIVGEGRERSRLGARVKQAGLEPVTRWVGAVSDPQHALRLMRVFVFLPTPQEGLGLALLEAMASGLPIVSVKRGRSGATWLLAESQVGLTVEGDDAHRLADAIASVLEDPSHARRLGERGRRVAGDHYRLTDMVSATEGVYRECLNAS